MKTYELVPQYDTRQSFYKKAMLAKDGTTIKLKSYDTIVAEYNPTEGVMEVFGWYSGTTMRHINEFLLQYGFSKKAKKGVADGLTLTHLR